MFVRVPKNSEDLVYVNTSAVTCIGKGFIRLSCGSRVTFSESLSAEEISALLSDSRDLGVSDRQG